MSTHVSARLDRVRERIANEGLTALVVFGAADCRYLTEFTGEAAAVCVTATECVLFTDPRFTIQAAEQAPGARTVISTNGRDELIPDVLQAAMGGSGAGGSVGVDPTHLTVRRWEALRPLLEDADVEWRLVPAVVEKCRQVKFPDELDAMRRSAALVTEAFVHLEQIPVVGRSERDVALDLEVHLREAGSEGVAFPFIVAAGARGAMPHAEPSETIIQKNSLLVVDIGTVVDGYTSDITRTYATGEIDEELATAYEAVRRVQAEAVAAVRAGVACGAVDASARAGLEEAGLGQLFVHSLGHGLGLEVHEDPGLSSRSGDILMEGMVVTVEPGVYIEGKAGIRIEDSVIVHADGAEVITDWPRDLRYLS